MKYSFFSSACTWLPSALMIAVSASGASSAPLASCVRYVPAEIQNQNKRTSNWKAHFLLVQKEHKWSLLPLCLARYRPRTIIKHKVMKTTTATTPPIKAWSGPCCPKAFGSERRQGDRRRNTFICKVLCDCVMQLSTFIKRGQKIVLLPQFSACKQIPKWVSVTFRGTCCFQVPELWSA